MSLDAPASFFFTGSRMTPQEAFQILERALADHQAGREAEAEAEYRRVLAAQPDNADALHLLGMLATQHGQPATALPLLQRAVQLMPGTAQFHIHYAQALAATGRHPEALAAFHRAIQLDPKDAQARAGAAASLAEVGRATDALEQHRNAAELAPGNAGIAGNYGMALFCAGRSELALQVLRHAVTLNPDELSPQLQLGEALWLGLSYEEANEIARRVTARAPADVRGWMLLGNTFETMARFEEAADSYRKVLQLDPDNFDASNNLALTLLNMGEAKQSLEMYEHVLARWPDRADARTNRSMAMLTLGDLAGGFEEFESRWKHAAFARAWPTPNVPRWHGENPAGRSILLTTEQGIGDVLHFVRYAPLVARRGATVHVAASETIHPFLATVAGVSKLVRPGEAPPPVHWYAPVASLPHIFRTTLENVPAEVPYISADAQLIAQWRDRLADDPNVKVGLAWAGNPAHQNDRSRSCRLADLAPLAGVDRVTFYSLQVGESSKQPVPTGMRFVQLGPDLPNTAAALENFDLLISVDTGIAHLGGALARPVWLALAHGPDWRWMLERDDSPWYPTFRLFRQARPGEWGPVFARMAGALRDLVKERGKQAGEKPHELPVP